MGNRFYTGCANRGRADGGFLGLCPRGVQSNFDVYIEALASSTIAPAGSSADQPKISPSSEEEQRVYRDRVQVRNVHVGEGLLGNIGVFGEVKNSGDRPLSEVEVTIYCLGKDGKPVFEETYHPVPVSSLDSNVSRILEPGYARQFGVKLDDAPSDWSKKVNVVVTNVRFE